MFFLSISNKFPFLISFFFFSYIEALPRQYSMTMHFKNVLVLLLQQDQLPVVLVVLQAHILPTGQLHSALWWTQICNINTHNLAEGCFSHAFFIFYISSYQPL